MSKTKIVSNANSPMVEIDFSTIKCRESVLSICEHAFLGHINIRGSLDNSKFAAAAKKSLGIDLPGEANTFVEHNAKTILWLGPNEWLLVCDADATANLVETLKSNFEDIFSAVTDVSGGNTTLEISGDRARAILLKGTPLDLHHSVFSKGQCAQTVVAKTGMTLWQISDDPIYKMIVRRSFSDYLGHWILDAAREYQEF